MPWKVFLGATLFFKLQIATGIAKCDEFITNCDMCYEVR